MQLWENTREPTLTCLFILSSWGHNDGEGSTTIIMLFHKSQVILLHLGRSVKTITTATTTKTKKSKTGLRGDNYCRPLQSSLLLFLLSLYFTQL